MKQLRILFWLNETSLGANPSNRIAIERSVCCTAVLIYLLCVKLSLQYYFLVVFPYTICVALADVAFQPYSCENCCIWKVYVFECTACLFVMNFRLRSDHAGVLSSRRVCAAFVVVVSMLEPLYTAWNARCCF